MVQLFRILFFRVKPPFTLMRPVHERWPINDDNPFGQPDKTYTDLGYLGHPGVDFLTPLGTPVVASADGICVTAREVGTAGLMVRLEHGKEYATRYLHLRDTFIREGFRVKRGTVIGLSGNSGLSTGPHLHFDLYDYKEAVTNGYGGRVNPLPLMEAR